MRWRDARRHGGLDGLQVRFYPGRPLKLGIAKRRRLVRLLLKGPMARGYRANLWTTARIAELVEREFDVRYHPDRIGRLMHSLGWAPEKTEKRALERDEEEIERWRQKERPRIKNTAELGAHLVFADESGFLLIPNAVITWAPQGQTHIHRHRQVAAGQDLRHFRHFCKPQAASPWSLLPTLL
jgi:transposase